jgi:hypothetical protein
MHSNDLERLNQRQKDIIEWVQSALPDLAPYLVMDEDFHIDFNPGDRDSIVVKVEGLKVWGIIDTYDRDCLRTTPADAATCRVLTIMLPTDVSC